MQKVYGHTLSSIATSSGASKAQNFRAFSDVFDLAEDGTFPRELAMVMSDLRIPFTHLYQAKPKMLLPRRARDISAEMKAWQDSVAKGVEMCTYKYMLDSFSEALRDEAKWPTHDVAFDHLEVAIRASTSACQSYLSGASGSKRKHSQKNPEAPSHNSGPRSHLSQGVSLVGRSAESSSSSRDRKKARVLSSNPLDDHPLDDGSVA